MTTLPNPFLNSVTPPSPAVTDTAAADQVAPQVAAAELIAVARTDVLQTVGTTVSAHGGAITESSMTNGGDQRTPASAPPKNPDVGVLADRIDWHEFFEAVMDERIVLFELTDELPLFLKDGDHLRRYDV